MQKYQNSVTNRRGDAIVGASVRVTLPNDSLATIYSDDGVTLATNPMTTDAFGYFGFYAANGRYNITVFGSGITTATYLDILLEDDEAALENRPTLAQLAASNGATLIGTSDGTVQFALNARPTSETLAASGGAALIGTSEGTAQAAFNARVKTVVLAANTGSTLVGYKSPLASTVDRTVQTFLDDYISVSNNSVDKTGATDSTAGIQAALTASAGAVVRLPRGQYRYTSLSIPANTYLVGEGIGNTTLICTATTGDTITTGAASGIANMGITYLGTPTSGTIIRLMGNLSSIDSVELTKYFIGVAAGDAVTRVITPRISRCNFRAPTVASGTGAIFLQNYGNAILDKCVVAGPTSGTQPDFGIRIHNGDTAFLTDCNVTLHGYALFFDVPALLNNYALRVSGCLFDSAKTITSTSVVAAGRIAPAGNIYDALFSNCWFGLSTGGSGLDITTTGSGVVDGIAFSNCQFVDNADAGLAVLSTAVKQVIVTGGYASSNAVYGYRFVAGVGDFTLSNVVAGDVGGRGANARGINIDTGAGDHYVIRGCRARGNSVFNFFDGGTGVNKVVEVIV